MITFRFILKGIASLLQIANYLKVGYSAVLEIPLGTINGHYFLKQCKGMLKGEKESQQAL